MSGDGLNVVQRANLFDINPDFGVKAEDADEKTLTGVAGIEMELRMGGKKRLSFQSVIEYQVFGGSVDISGENAPQGRSTENTEITQKVSAEALGAGKFIRRE